MFLPGQVQFNLLNPVTAQSLMSVMGVKDLSFSYKRKLCILQLDIYTSSGNVSGLAGQSFLVLGRDSW